jgi:hypothetical protein
LTRKFRSLPQFGQVNVTHNSSPLDGALKGSEPLILCNGWGQAQCKIEPDDPLSSI